MRWFCFEVPAAENGINTRRRVCSPTEKTASAESNHPTHAERDPFPFLPSRTARGPPAQEAGAPSVARAGSASVSGRIRMAKRSRLCSSVAGCGWRNWCVPQASGPAAGRSAPGAFLASVKQAVPLHSARACAVRSRCTRKKKKEIEVENRPHSQLRGRRRQENRTRARGRTGDS